VIPSTPRSGGNKSSAESSTNTGEQPSPPRKTPGQGPAPSFGTVHAIATPVPNATVLERSFRQGIEGSLWCVGVFDEAAIGQVGSAHSDARGDGAGPPDSSRWPAKSTGLRRCRTPGLPHYQKRVLVEDVCVVVESLLGHIFVASLPHLTYQCSKALQHAKPASSRLSRYLRWWGAVALADDLLGQAGLISRGPVGAGRCKPSRPPDRRMRS
jgi:hypothetical protein